MNPSMIAAIVLCGVVGLSTAARAQEKLELVKEGKSSYVIVVRADASPSEKRGAEELQRHLQQISGARLPIISENEPAREHEIVVGDGPRGLKLDRELGEEGFVLKTVGHRLFIVGSPVRGAMYGCYDVLEKLGVRWYTASVTQIPQSATLTLTALDEKQIPAFEYREPFFTEAWDTDFSARNRINGHHHQLTESTGGQVKFAKPFVHSFDFLVPQSLFEQHPEFFPFRDGQRNGGYVQRCLTNPQVLEMTVARVRQWIDEQPDAILFSVSQNDTGQWCQCGECKAVSKKYGGHAGLYVWFVNQVAEQIETDHPDKLIETLAYQFTEAPPTGIVPRKNVRIRLCPISCCEAHPYEQCEHPHNQAFVQRLRAWSQITDSLYIWHYNTNFAHYVSPFPDFAQFPDSARMYRRNGVKGIFFQGAYARGGGGADAELKSWVMSKVLWNPDVDADALVTEWMQGVYGPAWEPMRQWFDLLHAQVQAPDAHLFIYQHPGPERFTDEVKTRGNELFEGALRLAQTDVQRNYIRKTRLGLTYVELLHHPDTADKLQRFLDECRAFGIRRLSEGQRIDDWEKDYRLRHGG